MSVLVVSGYLCDGVVRGVVRIDVGRRFTREGRRRVH